jgi:type IV pilus assembly protein PilC
VSTDLYRYTARTANGESIAGTLRAESLAAAAVDLKRRALFVTSIARPSATVSLPSTFGRGRRASHAFFRAFAVLVRAGVAIRRALLVAIEHCGDPALREALRAVLADVENGSSLSLAMTRRPRDFSPLQTAMIGAGEAGGVLDDVLERIADVMDREHTVRKRIEAALMYPAVVACGAVALVAFLVIRVVPMFASLFERFGAPLPLPTRALLGAGAWLASPRAVLLAGAGALVAFAALRAYRRSPAVWDRARLRVPAIGALLRHAVIARVTRMLGILLRSGVGMLAAIDVVAPVAGSALYANALAGVQTALRRGESLHQAMRRSALFDPLTLALVGVGEETGALDVMLLKAADYLDVEVEARLASLAALIEPALIGFLGVAVGLIVFSIFLPLYGLMGSIS